MTAVPIERIDGVRVARPRGDIDAANASQFERELAESLEPDGDCLVLDFRETRYLDSAALDMVFRLNERLRQRRGGLQVVIPGGSPLSRLATIVGLPQGDPCAPVGEGGRCQVHAGSGGPQAKRTAAPDRGRRRVPRRPPSLRPLIAGAELPVVVELRLGLPPIDVAVSVALVEAAGIRVLAVDVDLHQLRPMLPGRLLRGGQQR